MQLLSFTGMREKLDALDTALDAIRNKYGKDAIVRGSLLSQQVH